MLWNDKRERVFVECSRFMWAITFGWWPRYLSKKSQRESVKSMLEFIKNAHPEWQDHFDADTRPEIVVKYISEGSMLGPVISAEKVFDRRGFDTVFDDTEN